MYQLAAKGMNGRASGLHIASLMRYGHSDVLERADNGVPVYVHLTNCPQKCGRKCNSDRGSKIGDDIAEVERLRPKLAVRRRKWMPVRSWHIFTGRREQWTRELVFRWTDDIRPKAVTHGWGYVYYENGADKYCAHG